MSVADILVSILTGCISSAIVVLFLYRLRPKIEISDHISELVVDGTLRYGFK